MWHHDGYFYAFEGNDLLFYIIIYERCILKNRSIVILFFILGCSSKGGMIQIISLIMLNMCSVCV